VKNIEAMFSDVEAFID